MAAAAVLWLGLRFAGCGGSDLTLAGNLPQTPTPGPGTPTATTCATTGQFCDNATVICCSGLAACNTFSNVCNF